MANDLPRWVIKAKRYLSLYPEWALGEILAWERAVALGEKNGVSTGGTP